MVIKNLTFQYDNFYHITVDNRGYIASFFNFTKPSNGYNWPPTEKRKK